MSTSVMTQYLHKNIKHLQKIYDEEMDNIWAYAC